jgi:hypothetical protein
MRASTRATPSPFRSWNPNEFDFLLGVAPPRRGLLVHVRQARSPLMAKKSVAINGTVGTAIIQSLSKRAIMAQLQLIPASEIQPQEPRWLWERRVPRGGITLIEGDPGQGKSTLICDLAGRITTGRPMPDSAESQDPGVVILLQGDDAMGTTQRNLHAVGADLRRVFVVDRRAQGIGRPLVLPDDIDFLAEHVRRLSAVQVVIDPVTAFLRIDTHHDQAVRETLSPLSTLAEQTDAAIVLVRHLTKSGGSNPIYRGAGSIGLIAAARSALLVGTCPSDPGQRVVAHSKSSLSHPAVSLAFQTVSRGAGAAIDWLGPIAITSEQLLEAGRRASRSELSEAAYVLYSLLADGPLLAVEVKSAAKDAGISDRTLRRAKELLQVASLRKGFGPESRFYWKLPPQNEMVKTLRQSDLHELVDRLCHGEGESPLDQRIQSDSDSAVEGHEEG